MSFRSIPRRGPAALLAITVAAVAALAGLSGPADATQFVIKSSADATVRAGHNSNLGSDERLVVDAQPQYVTLVRFDVSAVSTTQVIRAATLRLYVVDASPRGGEVSLVSSQWNEQSVTWSSMPAAGARVASIAKVTTGSWVEVQTGPLTPTAGAISFLLTSSNKDAAAYASRETARPPQLVIDSSSVGPPTTTPPPTTSPSPSPQAPGSSGIVVAAIGDLCGAACGRVAQLVRGMSPSLVIGAGDLAYPDGTFQQFMSNYDPYWGTMKQITASVPGNHEWHTPNAQGWRDYFSVIGPTYRSFDRGGWHFIGLDTMCDKSGGCVPGTRQYEWLIDDLAATTERCTIAFYHHATFSDGTHGNSTKTVAFWRAMDAEGVDIVLVGHDHTYQRFVPQTADGTADPQGIREFVVGTGGASLYPFDSTPQPNRVVGISQHGALFLTLGDGSYRWEWRDLTGAVRDSGQASCV